MIENIIVAAGGSVSSLVSNVIRGALTTIDILIPIFSAQALTVIGVAQAALGGFQIGLIISSIVRAGQVSTDIERRTQAGIRGLDGVLSIIGRFNH